MYIAQPDGKVYIIVYFTVDKANTYTKKSRFVLSIVLAHLFVKAKKLTVAYPTVQDAIDVDVVGLWERRETDTLKN